MGKIKVRGFAERKVEADECIYTVTFTHADIYESEAIRRVKENSDRFLKLLKENGTDISKIELSNDSVSKYSNNLTCTRTLKIISDASAKTSNLLFRIINDNRIEATISTEYRYSKNEQLHKELLDLAVKDSKEKANIIASASDSKVVDIDYMSFDRYELDEDDLRVSVQYSKIKCSYEQIDSINEISNELSNRLNTEREEVFITWNIE